MAKRATRTRDSSESETTETVRTVTYEAEELGLFREVELAELKDLRPHPGNYRRHPEDQLEHLRESIRRNGVYRPIVVAEDGTILAGHGLYEALLGMGNEASVVVRMPYGPDDPRALKLLAGDNEISRMAEIDDRALSEMLRSVRELDPERGLLGTGYDEMMLANLVFVTRSQSEIPNFNAAAEWVGMPDYEPGETQYKLVLICATEEDRQRALTLLELPVDKKVGLTFSTRYPWTDREDKAALRWEP